jgi:hypothetical protein
LELENRQILAQMACDRLLSEAYLNLNEDTLSQILENIDYFVSQSRGNESVKDVTFCPLVFNGHDDEVCSKVGQAIGNLWALEKKLHISIHSYHDDDDDNDMTMK